MTLQEVLNIVNRARSELSSLRRELDELVSVVSYEMAERAKAGVQAKAEAEAKSEAERYGLDEREYALFKLMMSSLQMAHTPMAIHNRASELEKLGSPDRRYTSCFRQALVEWIKNRRVSVNSTMGASGEIMDFAFELGSCLSIAEGALGWEDAKVDSNAAKAVRSLRRAFEARKIECDGVHQARVAAEAEVHWLSHIVMGDSIPSIHVDTNLIQAVKHLMKVTGITRIEKQLGNGDTYRMVIRREAVAEGGEPMRGNKISKDVAE